MNVVNIGFSTLCNFTYLLRFGDTFLRFRKRLRVLREVVKEVEDIAQ